MKKIKPIILTTILCLLSLNTNVHAGKLKIRTNETIAKEVRDEKIEKEKEAKKKILEEKKKSEDKTMRVNARKPKAKAPISANKTQSQSKPIKAVEKKEQKAEVKRKEDFPPIKLSVQGVRISSMFGPRLRPTPGASAFHQGVDIGAPKGTLVYAVNDGTVIYAKSSGGSGNKIIIDHGKGVQSVYMHMSKRAVNVGDKVLGGHIVGTVGNTGISTGSHLHYEIHHNGIRKDPINIIKRK